MRTLVIYDSQYGNTEKLATAIAHSIKGMVIVKHVENVTIHDIDVADMLIIGSPTQGGRPSQNIRQFLRGLPESAVAHKTVAAFDTRLALQEQNPALRLIMRMVGFAAPHIAADLKTKGAIICGRPEGFIVEGKEGPLRNWEINRAVEWAEHIAELALVQPTFAAEKVRPARLTH